MPVPPDSLDDPGVDLADEIRIEQVRLVVKNIPTIVIANLVNALLTVAFFWNLGPRRLLLASLVVFAILSADRIRAWGRFRSKPRPSRMPARAVKRTIVISTCAGLLWGLFSALIFPAESLPHQMLLCFVGGGMATGALAGLGAIRAATRGYIVACLTPLIIRLAIAGNSLQWLMVAMIALYGVVLLILSQNAYLAFVDGVKLRVSNAKLTEATELANRKLREKTEQLTRDLAELQHTKAEVKRLDALLARAIDSIEDAVSLYDADGRLILANRTLRQRLGEYAKLYTPGRAWEEIVRGYYVTTPIAANPEVLEHMVAHAVERHRSADGLPREIEVQQGVWWQIRNYRTDDGGVLAISTDVTAVKEAEEKITRANILLTDAMEAIGDGIVLYDSHGRLRLANKAQKQLFGDTADVFVPGKTFEEIACDLRRAIGWSLDDEPSSIALKARMEQFRRADGVSEEHHLPNDRWFLARYFRTSDGGVLGVITDITAWKQHEADLIAARAEADKANRAKSDFLASMSHEIRTPMNGVIGFADLLLDSNLNDGQRENVERIREAGKSLLAIINDILDISKIEAGKLELEALPMSPASIVDSAASILGKQVVGKGLKLKVELEAGLPGWISGDPTRVRQILLNLLSNALKFTDAGQIAIRCRRETGQGKPLLRFEVSDTGIGIPKDRQHLLFQDFSQLDRSTTRRFGGTGLGLSICRRLAEAMGGQIGVSSEPGLGSLFWFTMALVETSQPKELTAKVSLLKDASPARILVAEDLPMNQLIVQGMLGAAGHEVTVVGNGAEALEAIQASRFDLILMDMEMPEMDGISATRAIRALEKPACEVPIIALTANAMLDDAAACRAAGMNDFLSKPIIRDELVAMIRKWSGVKAGEPPPGAEAGSAPVLDEAVLQGIERLLGKEKAAGLTEMFRQRVEQMVPLFSGLEDRTTLARETHNLVSLAGNIGCMELMNAARDLSGALKRDAADVPALTTTIIDAADRALSALNRRPAA